MKAMSDENEQPSLSARAEPPVTSALDPGTATALTPDANEREPPAVQESGEQQLLNESLARKPSDTSMQPSKQTSMGPELRALNSLVDGVPITRLSADIGAARLDSKSIQESPSDEKAQKGAGIFKAFRYATKRDWAMICIAWICSLGNGVLGPLNFVVLGNAFSEMMDMSMDVFETMMRHFIILGCVALVASSISSFLLELSAERQLRRVKLLYLESVMRQEVGYFDIKDCGSLAAEVEAASVQASVNFQALMELA
eukprot:Gregarina_sp_Poly_1__3148@NODE_1891_length_3131_cov_35_067232_g470_i1_p2_GENE_NODE_1891_length_3131_cov_35_067232_g470_i1NODE_1891_length_3131_cov_35_067232_g470_i1_p2_ORF_typecomplete_len257_score52_35ABC_membrane/PF00664_23/3_4e10_NODE_1891_length_3131_cov_35_067232_g470_i122353005